MVKGKVELLDIKLKYGRSRFAVAMVKSDLYVFGGLGSMNSTEVLNLKTLEIREGVKLPNSAYGFTVCSF